MKAAGNALLSNPLPSEGDTLKVLGQCNGLADLLVLERPSVFVDDVDSAVNLLHLDETSSRIPLHKLPIATQQAMQELSKLAYNIVKYPPVFISPRALAIYTRIQSNLGKPESFPEVFNLYANKPMVKEGSSSSGVEYMKQNPNRIANAVAAPVANMALKSAIDSKQLVLAMDIIDSTFNTRAFLRAKFMRKCLVPATGMALAPLAAYTAATGLANWQTTMEPEMATNVAFAGILAYTFFTGTIGVVAVTTANDQMERVTWAPGMPLRQRWMREEERKAMDLVAVAWGFRETWRRGEEEGEDWDALREWVGMKGMILDRVELMEGME